MNSGLDSLDSSSILQFPLVIRDCSKSSKYNWYTFHLHVPWLFKFPGEVQVFVQLFLLLSPWILLVLQNSIDDKFFSSCQLKFSGLFVDIRWFLYITKLREFYAFLFQKQILVWANFYLLNDSTRAGYDTWSLFQQSLTGLNSFFFQILDLLPYQASKHRLPNYLPIAGWKKI